MAGENTGQVDAGTGAVATGDPSATDANADPNAQAKDPASAGLNADLARERKLRQQREAELNELKEKNLSEQERVVKQRDELMSENKELKLTNKRQELALKLNMPWSLARRIQGDTPEEMETDAKDLLSNFKKEADGESNKNNGGTGKKPPTNDGGKAGQSGASDPNALLKKALNLR